MNILNEKHTNHRGRATFALFRDHPVYLEANRRSSNIYGCKINAILSRDLGFYYELLDDGRAQLQRFFTQEELLTFGEIVLEIPKLPTDYNGFISTLSEYGGNNNNFQTFVHCLPNTPLLVLRALIDAVLVYRLRPNRDKNFIELLESL